MAAQEPIAGQAILPASRDGATVEEPALNRVAGRAVRSRWLAPAFVFGACLACDQWTKMWATDRLKPVAGAHFLGDMLRIQYAENPGAFLGAGGGLPATERFWLLVVVNAVVLVAIPAVVVAKSQLARSQLFAVALLLSGGIGNLLDRVFHDGRVVDFLNMGIGPLRTGIFNVADMAIMAGFALMIFHRGPTQTAPAQTSAAAERSS